ncbi:MAG: galactose mutarotase [Ruminococcaceae bacterium]|nr:galactose mutarotase [Oscillospiraceae bacterium]
MSIQKRSFGHLPDGREVTEYMLQNRYGVKICILDLGGAIRELWVPDRLGLVSDVICGFDRATDYLQATGCHGALIGRFANRIAGARFSLCGKEYALSQNRPAFHLHGGFEGFHLKLWQVTPIDGEEPALVLHYDSPDGEEGYPGNLSVTVTYTLKAPATFSMHYEATTDAPTVLNLSNHSYFNLGGYDSGSIYDHILTLGADHVLDVDKDGIPTGRFNEVADTVFDFRRPKRLGEDIHAPALSLGYDHCYCFSQKEREPLSHRATLFHPQSGRKMQLYTTMPAVQLFTANFSNDQRFPFKRGVAQHPHCAVCLETQKMPDSPHHAHFTPAALFSGEKYDHITEYVFSIEQ